MDDDAVFLGYMAKRDRAGDPEWGHPPHVRILGNATNCVDGGEPWDGLFNTSGFNDCYFAHDVAALRRAVHWERTEGRLPEARAQGWSVAYREEEWAVEGDPPPYWVYAYWTYPVWFDRTGRRHEGLHPLMHPPLLNGAPSMEGFAPIGYDPVQLYVADVTGRDGALIARHSRNNCSPLCCNHYGLEMNVNAWCLIDRFDDALAAAERFALEQPEPGDYAVYRVFRGPMLT